MKTQDKEQEITKMYELATDWLGESVSDKVNEITARCLDFDISKSLKELKAEGKKEVLKEIYFLLEEKGYNAMAEWIKEKLKK